MCGSGDGVKLPKYLPRIMAAMETSPYPAGSIVDVVVKHDDWCPMLNGGTVCSCDPDVEIEGVMFPPSKYKGAR